MAYCEPFSFLQGFHHIRSFTNITHTNECHSNAVPMYRLALDANLLKCIISKRCLSSDKKANKMSIVIWVHTSSNMTYTLIHLWPGYKGLRQASISMTTLLISLVFGVEASMSMIFILLVMVFKAEMSTNKHPHATFSIIKLMDCPSFPKESMVWQISNNDF